MDHHNRNQEVFNFNYFSFFVVGLHQCQIFVSPNHVPSFVTFLVWFGLAPNHITEPSAALKQRRTADLSASNNSFGLG